MKQTLIITIFFALGILAWCNWINQDIQEEDFISIESRQSLCEKQIKNELNTDTYEFNRDEEIPLEDFEYQILWSVRSTYWVDQFSCVLSKNEKSVLIEFRDPNLFWWEEKIEDPNLYEIARNKCIEQNWEEKYRRFDGEDHYVCRYENNAMCEYEGLYNWYCDNWKIWRDMILQYADVYDEAVEATKLYWEYISEEIPLYQQQHEYCLAHDWDLKVDENNKEYCVFKNWLYCYLSAIASGSCWIEEWE